MVVVVCVCVCVYVCVCMCVCVCVCVYVCVWRRVIRKAIQTHGVENIVYVPSAAAFCPSRLVCVNKALDDQSITGVLVGARACVCGRLTVAVQSVSVTTLKPFSYAVRIVDSTQQFVKNLITQVV